jgi:hypothetical protein
VCVYICRYIQTYTCCIVQCHMISYRHITFCMQYVTLDSLPCKPEAHVNCCNKNLEVRNHLLTYWTRQGALQVEDDTQATHKPPLSRGKWDTPWVSDQNLPMFRKATLFPTSGHTALKTDGVFHSKRRNISIRLHGVTRQKTIFVAVTAARTSLVALPYQ